MIDWSKIKTVFLDLDGTLLDLHFDNHFWLKYVPEQYAEHYQLSIEESHSLLNKKYTEVYGSLNWYCVEYWSKELGLDIAALKHNIRDKISIRPYVVEFLEALHMHGKRVVLVTNAHPLSFQVKFQKTGLGHYFHHIITSHELHHAKEEQAFWLALEKVEDVDKASTLFIDDNFSVLDAAAEYGIGHLLAIKQPDSTEPDKEHDLYHLLDSFEDIIPQ
ncbi:MAG: GMP/IMP nucleotidase [endosymbiont of Galathealinum brachiosum]|uniref:GMP/IMP nucleotidase n=1 Tax=endosymbiont of Galathealinum brachiosum TaxID=2200906 RepID=A0A370DBR8_9GAMM|nr:MAG: GMP/IMP nucleotidase [endosymbiont of Galathealinum brachiosum]